MLHFPAAWPEQGNFPKGICLKSWLHPLLPAVDLPLILNPWGFDPRCTRKVHIYMSPGSDSNTGTIHPDQILPNKPPAHSTFKTKHTSSWGFMAFLGPSAPSQTSCTLPVQRFGVHCPQPAPAGSDHWPHHWFLPGCWAPLVLMKQNSFVLKNTSPKITCWVSEAVSLWNSPNMRGLPKPIWANYQAYTSPPGSNNSLWIAVPVTEPMLRISSSLVGF